MLRSWLIVLILRPVAAPPFVAVTPRMSSPGARKLLSLAELQATAVHPRVVDALREVSRHLAAVKVRHAVVGAIAVGAHGWPRATSDVDLLVGPEAWKVAPDGSESPAVDLPEEVDGVAIDYLSIDVAGDFLLDCFGRARADEHVPIAPIEVVILTKLIRLAMRDQADIVELVKAGLFDRAAVERYLEDNAPMLTRRFRALVEQGEWEATGR